MENNIVFYGESNGSNPVKGIISVDRTEKQIMYSADGNNYTAIPSKTFVEGSNINITDINNVVTIGTKSTITTDGLQVNGNINLTGTINSVNMSTLENTVSTNTSNIATNTSNIETINTSLSNKISTNSDASLNTLSIAGNLTTSGLVDGRDVSNDGNALDLVVSRVNQDLKTNSAPAFNGLALIKPSSDAAIETILKLSRNNYDNDKGSFIAFNTESSDWTKTAIGNIRKGASDKSDLLFLVNDLNDNSTVTLADERMRVTASGIIVTGSVNATTVTSNNITTMNNDISTHESEISSLNSTVSGNINQDVRSSAYPSFTGINIYSPTDVIANKVHTLFYENGSKYRNMYNRINSGNGPNGINRYEFYGANSDYVPGSTGLDGFSKTFGYSFQQAFDGAVTSILDIDMDGTTLRSPLTTTSTVNGRNIANDGNALDLVVGRVDQDLKINSAPEFNSLALVKQSSNAIETVLKLSRADIGTGKGSFIAFNAERAAWTKTAIGNIRTDSYDRSNLLFLINGLDDNSTVTMDDERMRITTSGIRVTGSVEATGSVNAATVTSNNITTIENNITTLNGYVDQNVKSSAHPSFTGISIYTPTDANANKVHTLFYENGSKYRNMYNRISSGNGPSGTNRYEFYGANSDYVPGSTGLDGFIKTFGYSFQQASNGAYTSVLDIDMDGTTLQSPLTTTGTVNGRNIANDGTTLDNLSTTVTTQGNSIATINTSLSNKISTDSDASLNTLSIAGNLTTSGLIDGRDISNDGTALDLVVSRVNQDVKASSSPSFVSTTLSDSLMIPNATFNNDSSNPQIVVSSTKPFYIKNDDGSIAFNGSALYTNNIYEFTPSAKINLRNNTSITGDLSVSVNAAVRAVANFGINLPNFAFSGGIAGAIAEYVASPLRVLSPPLFTRLALTGGDATNILNANTGIIGPAIGDSTITPQLGDGDWLWFYGRNGTTQKRFYQISSTAFFTGQHAGLCDTINMSNVDDNVGLIVVATGEYFDERNGSEQTGKDAINIVQTLPKVALSTTYKQKSAYGVIANINNWNNGMTSDTATALEGWDNGLGKKIRINASGEGAVWIVSKIVDGVAVSPIENGDYFTTSMLPGFGMIQDDDLLHNYTVGKSTCDCTFELNSSAYQCEEFVDGVDLYRKAFIGCTYHCG